MAWTCLWEGCPSRGFRFTHITPMWRPELLRVETFAEANMRDAQHHHATCHQRPAPDNPRLSPPDTLD